MTKIQSKEKGFVLLSVMIAALLISIVVNSVITQSNQDAQLSQYAWRQLNLWHAADYSMQRLTWRISSTSPTKYPQWIELLSQKLYQDNAELLMQFCAQSDEAWEMAPIEQASCHTQSAKIAIKFWLYAKPIADNHYLYQHLPTLDSQQKAYHLLVYVVATKPANATQATDAFSCFSLPMKEQQALRCLQEKESPSQSIASEFVLINSQTVGNQADGQQNPKIQIDDLYRFRWYDVRLIRD